MSEGGLTNEQVRWSEAIRQRLAACAQAGDARKAEAYASCFTQNGVLALDDVTISGRTELLLWMRGPSVIPAPTKGEVGFISHHLTTSSITFVNDSEASVRTYWLVTSASGLDHNGYYVDSLERVGEDWFIAHRRPRTLWISPTSVLRNT